MNDVLAPLLERLSRARTDEELAAAIAALREYMMTDSAGARDREIVHAIATKLDEFDAARRPRGR